jgi:hypothetical protein
MPTQSTTAPTMARASLRQADILHFATAMVIDCAATPFDLHATVTDADNGTSCLAFLPSNVLSDFWKLRMFWQHVSRNPTSATS